MRSSFLNPLYLVLYQKSPQYCDMSMSMFVDTETLKTFSRCFNKTNCETTGFKS